METSHVGETPSVNSVAKSLGVHHFHRLAMCKLFNLVFISFLIPSDGDAVGIIISIDYVKKTHTLTVRAQYILLNNCSTSRPKGCRSEWQSPPFGSAQSCPTTDSCPCRSSSLFSPWNCGSPSSTEKHWRSPLPSRVFAVLPGFINGAGFLLADPGACAPQTKLWQP